MTGYKFELQRTTVVCVHSFRLCSITCYDFTCIINLWLSMKMVQFFGTLMSFYLAIYKYSEIVLNAKYKNFLEYIKFQSNLMKLKLHAGKVLKRLLFLSLFLPNLLICTILIEVAHLLFAIKSCFVQCFSFILLLFYLLDKCEKLFILWILSLDHFKVL